MRLVAAIQVPRGDRCQELQELIATRDDAKMRAPRRDTFAAASSFRLLGDLSSSAVRGASVTSTETQANRSPFFGSRKPKVGLEQQ